MEWSQNQIGKRVELREAIQHHVQPGMALHLSGGIGGPSAAICEIIRQYWGKKPRFTLIQSTLAGHSLHLIYCHLVSKLIFSACPPDITGSMLPSRILQKAIEENHMEIENWSLCSLQQRLMAGAMGVPFMPTRSISHSTMAKENVDAFQEIDDPFKSGKSIGLVKALTPDLSIVHGVMADVNGNTILAAPVGDDLWGPLASKNGVLVTVEKIVETEVIRGYSSLVKIPSFKVKTVSEVPFGVHPFSLFISGIPTFEAYGQDKEFLNELHKTYRSDQLDDWLKKWVMDCQTHTDYLNKIGKKRLARLKERVISSPSEAPPSDRHSNQRIVDGETMMSITLAREMIKSVHTAKHKTILIGGGSRTLGGWMAYHWLKKEGVEVELIIGNGQIGCIPKRGEGITANLELMRTATMLTDVITTHGVFVGGNHNECLAVLGAGQIDPYGNINSTRGEDGRFLVGSGGGNDAVNAREVMVVMEQSRNRFIENLPYITSPGYHVSTVISTMGIFRKTGPKERLILTSCFPHPDFPTLKERIRHIQDHCGWSLKIAEPMEEIPLPTEEELRLREWLLYSNPTAS